ncbi:MAG: lipid-binding SYLF domain-containing protein, partial [Candidatus Caldatribacteriota bacterium]|nr:lipid-binding SYLF domain-containing protein [Candidatus Caldatribacteriota bacterium]
MKNRNINSIIFTLLLFMAFSCIGQAATMTPSEVINESIGVLEEMSASEDSGAFGALLKEAEGVAIFPSIIKIGWGVGGQYGKGIIFKKNSKLGLWYGPAFIKIKSLSIGPQIGIQSIALVLVISNERGMKGFMKDNFTLGGTASIAAGPLGRSLSADTDYKFKASIYSYSITKGAYIGVSFQGSTIEEDRSANKIFYKKSIENKSILKNKISLNPSIVKLLFLINKV